MPGFGKIAVLMGGPSAEREVSLCSGRAVAGALRTAGYEVSEIDLPGREVDLPAGVEAVFIALHGEFGEDGELQAWLDERGVPYSGSGAESSRVAFDKVLTKQRFRDAEVSSARYEVLRPGDPCSLPLPVVVKPSRQGSTIGVHRVDDAAQWPEAVEDAFRYGDAVIAETYVPGRELAVGVVGDDTLPVVEIVAPDGWYDYGAKYTKGRTAYHVPAPLSEDDSARCMAVGRGAYDCLGCRGFGRADLRMTLEGEVYALEVNSIPGFTETSLLPMAAAHAGMSFPELCARIMELAGTG